MRINNNITALNANNKLNANQFNLSKSVEKLSSGLRINRAGDDASGLAISEKLRAQVRGLNQATRNAQDGMSLLNIAEGALNETSAILQRLRELAVQSANDTLITADRKVIQGEANQLIEEIDRIADQTQFNTQVLSSNVGTTGASNGQTFQGVFHIGANESQTIAVSLGNMRSVADSTAGGGGGLDIASLTTAGRNLDGSGTAFEKGLYETQAGANAAIYALDNAIEVVTNERAYIGALTNRLENIVNVNTVSSENTSAAESRVRDVDMAKEMMTFTKNNILSQASQAMLAQANQLPQGVLQLLR